MVPAPLEYSLNEPCSRFIIISQYRNLYRMPLGSSQLLPLRPALSSAISLRVRVTALPVAPTYGGNNDGMIVAPEPSALHLTCIASTASHSAEQQYLHRTGGGFRYRYHYDARDCINTTGITVNNSAAPTMRRLSPLTCGNANGTITVTGYRRPHPAV